jgi:hypothetical protein
MKSLIKGYGREKRLRYTGLDNRLKDGDEVLSLMLRQTGRTLPQEDLWYSFVVEADFRVFGNDQFLPYDLQLITLPLDILYLALDIGRVVKRSTEDNPRPLAARSLRRPFNRLRGTF